MSSTLTPDGTTFPRATAPQAGESRSAESFAAAMQTQANRSQHLYEALVAIDPSRGGARSLRTVASITALAALPSPRDRDVAVVRDVGIYLFDGASTLAPSTSGLMMTVAPSGAAPGRWRLVGAGLATFGLPFGLPVLVGTTIPSARLEATSGGSKVRQQAIAGGLLEHYIGEDLGDAGLAAGNNDRALPQFTVVTAAAEVGEILSYRASVEALVGVGEVIQTYTVVTEPDAAANAGPLQAERPYDGKDQRRGLYHERDFVVRVAGVHKIETYVRTVGLVGSVSFSHGYVAFERTSPPTGGN